MTANAETYDVVVVGGGPAGATAANVKTGTVGFLRSGMFVQGAVATTAGSGATAGSYSVPVPAGSGGGPSRAAIQTFARRKASAAMAAPAKSATCVPTRVQKTLS